MIEKRNINVDEHKIYCRNKTDWLNFLDSLNKTTIRIFNFKRVSDLKLFGLRKRQGQSGKGTNLATVFMPNQGKKADNLSDQQDLPWTD